VYPYAGYLYALCLSTSPSTTYRVATISRLFKIIRLFCRISSLLQDSFAKETYNFKESTNRSHLICTNANTHTERDIQEKDTDHTV